MRITSNAVHLVLWVFLLLGSIPAAIVGIMLLPQPVAFFFLFFAVFCLCSGPLLGVARSVYLDDAGIRYAKISLSWESARITVHYQLFRGGVNLIAYVSDHYLTEKLIRSKNRFGNTVLFSLSPKKLSYLLTRTPYTVFYANEPGKGPSAIRSMVRMIDDHNHSVLEKQEKEITP